MKLADFKEQIDAYFERISPMEIVKQFEELGYEFEDIDDAYFIKIKPKVSSETMFQISTLGLGHIEKQNDIYALNPHFIISEYVQTYQKTSNYEFEKAA